MDAPKEINPQEGSMNASCAERRAKLERLLAMQERMEAIVARLPESLARYAYASDEWIQLSSLNREEVLVALSALRGGRWKKDVCHDDGTKVDYETTIDGIRVLLFFCEPPTSCRIETEEIVVLEHKEIRRKLVCA